MKSKVADKRGHLPKGLESEGEHPNSAPSAPPGFPGHLKFKRLLVPIDFSDSSLLALDYAVALGREFDSKLILLHVVEPAVSQENYFGVAAPMAETDQNFLEVGRERLAALAQKRSEPRQPIEFLVRIGRAHSEIVDTARATGADLIVVGTHGLTAVAHLLMGSTAERVVRHAPCPVLTVRLAGGS